MQRAASMPAARDWPDHLVPVHGRRLDAEEHRPVVAQPQPVAVELLVGDLARGYRRFCNVAAAASSRGLPLRLAGGLERQCGDARIGPVR